MVQEYQEQVLDKKRVLDNKIEALEAIIASVRFDRLSVGLREDLLNQHETMSQASEVFSKVIDSFGSVC